MPGEKPRSVPENELGEQPPTTHYPGLVDNRRGYRVAKRCLDLGFCLLALPVLLPLMALIGILVRLDSRGPALFVVTERGRTWDVRQIVDDPQGNHDWSITARVDLDECEDAGELVLHTLGFGRLDG